MAYTFAKYMKDIDIALTTKCGLGVNDLGDFDYSGAFNDERDPEEVADDILADNDFPVMERNEMYS